MNAHPQSLNSDHMHIRSPPHTVTPIGVSLQMMLGGCGHCLTSAGTGKARKGGDNSGERGGGQQQGKGGEMRDVERKQERRGCLCGGR